MVTIVSLLYMQHDVFFIYFVLVKLNFYAPMRQSIRFQNPHFVNSYAVNNMIEFMKIETIFIIFEISIIKH